MIYKINIMQFYSQNKYGINVFDGNTLIKSSDDITDNEADIAKLVDMCNELEIELCHFDDIIEDYLTDFHI